MRALRAIRSLCRAAGLLLALRICPAAAQEPPRYLKGQTHLHSNKSGDSNTPPEDVARWYASRGYDFIVFTDHDHVTQVAPRSGMLIIRGAELTQNLVTCHPRPEPGQGCLLHMNALFLDPGEESITWPPRRNARRLDLYQRALDLVSRRGGLAQLNHPNFEYAAGTGLIIEMARRGVLLMEIANQSEDCNNQGDSRHPSTEALWDQALSAGVMIYGVATDDAHHYYDAQRMRARLSSRYVHVGDRGFVMVRASKDPWAIRSAMARGDFYSSTGVLLKDVRTTAGALEVEVSDRAEGAHGFTFIGHRGRVLQQSEGRRAAFPLRLLRGGYVRAVVTDGQGRRAWVQPVRVP